MSRNRSDQLPPQAGSAFCPSQAEPAITLRTVQLCRPAPPHLLAFQRVIFPIATWLGTPILKAGKPRVQMSSPRPNVTQRAAQWRSQSAHKVSDLDPVFLPPSMGWLRRTQVQTGRRPQQES